MTFILPDPDELAEVAAPAVSNIYDHPVVVELMGKLSELTARMDQFQAQAKDAESHWRQAKDAKEAYINSINQRLAQFEADVRRAEQAKREIENQVWSIRNLKDEINAKIGQTIEEIQASQAAEEAEARWRELRESWDFAWSSEIRDFQMTAVKFIVDGFEAGHHGIGVFDQMGLGKTLEAAAAIDVIQGLPNFEQIIKTRCPNINFAAPESRAVLWLCPTSIKESTVRELKRWGRNNTIKLQGDPENRRNVVRIAREMGLTLVVGYEQLRDRKGKPITPELFEHEWTVVVKDEAHRFKNDNSSTFDRIEQISENAGFLIPMTGTPILNRPEELWSILHMLTIKGKMEGKFDNKARFLNEYCWSWGSKSEWAGNAYNRLIQEINDMVIRRRKDEVFEDMPDKVREVRFVELWGEQLDLYNEMRDKFLIWLDEQQTDFIGASNVLAQLSYLRQICLYPAGVKLKTRSDDGKIVVGERTLECEQSAKIDEAMNLIEELLANDEKVLVFANFNQPLKAMRRMLEERSKKGELTYKERPLKVGLVTGEQDEITKANVQDRFNDPEDGTAIVLGNIGAMGLGLNLQHACSHAIFLDLYWNPGINEQAEDRLHRQGQKNAVTIHVIQAEDTVDGFIQKLIEDKEMMISGIIERKELRQALKDGLI